MKCNVSYKYLFIAIGILARSFPPVTMPTEKVQARKTQYTWKHPIIKASSTSL